MTFLGLSIRVSTDITSSSATTAQPLSAELTSNSHSNGMSVLSVQRPSPDSGTYTAVTLSSPCITALPDSTSFERIEYSAFVIITRRMSSFVSGTTISELISQTFLPLPISLKLLKNLRSSEISISVSLAIVFVHHMWPSFAIFAYLHLLSHIPNEIRPAAKANHQN